MADLATAKQKLESNLVQVVTGLAKLARVYPQRAEHLEQEVLERISEDAFRIAVMVQVAMRKLRKFLSRADNAFTIWPSYYLIAVALQVHVVEIACMIGYLVSPTLGRFITKTWNTQLLKLQTAFQQAVDKSGGDFIRQHLVQNAGFTRDQANSFVFEDTVAVYASLQITFPDTCELFRDVVKGLGLPPYPQHIMQRVSDQVFANFLFSFFVEGLPEPAAPTPAATTTTKRQRVQAPPPPSPRPAALPEGLAYALPKPASPESHRWIYEYFVKTGNAPETTGQLLVLFNDAARKHEAGLTKGPYATPEGFRSNAILRMFEKGFLTAGGTGREYGGTIRLRLAGEPIVLEKVRPKKGKRKAYVEAAETQEAEVAAEEEEGPRTPIAGTPPLTQAEINQQLAELGERLSPFQAGEELPIFSGALLDVPTEGTHAAPGVHPDLQNLRGYH